MSSTLSVCLITKNEEKNLRRCLYSVRDICDEVVIVDTGSTDNTVAIANSLGTNVYFYPWNNDFSECRNIALDKCTMEWIFVIDADEEFEIEHSARLKEILNTTNKEGIYLNLKNIIGDTIINETSSLRIFRNRPEYRYKGKLHEQIFYAIKDLKGDRSLVVTDMVLKHYGYDHNVYDMNKKIQRNIEILESTEEKDKDGFFYFSLGSEYAKLSNHQKAKENFIKAKDTPSEDYGYKPYLAISLCKILYDLKQYQSALAYVESFLIDLAEFKDLYFLKSLCHFELGNYPLSYSSLLKFINTPVDLTKYPSFNFEADNDIDGILQWLRSNI